MVYAIGFRSFVCGSSGARTYARVMFTLLFKLRCSHINGAPIRPEIMRQVESLYDALIKQQIPSRYPADLNKDRRFSR